MRLSRDEESKPWGSVFDIGLKPRVRQESLLANLWYRQITADFSDKPVGNFGVTRDSFDGAGAWVCPQ